MRKEQNAKCGGAAWFAACARAGRSQHALGSKTPAWVGLGGEVSRKPYVTKCLPSPLVASHRSADGFNPKTPDVAGPELLGVHEVGVAAFVPQQPAHHLASGVSEHPVGRGEGWHLGS